MIGEPKKKQSFDDLLKSGSTNGEVKATGKNQTGTKSFDDLLSEDTAKPVEQPFTEAPAQGPNDQLSSASSTPLGTPLATSTVMPGPSGPVSPKVRKPLNPDDFASALDFGDKSIKSDATSVGRIWDNPLATSEAYGEQKKKDQERHLLQDRYDTEYSVLSPEGVTANLARAEQRKQQVLAQQEVLGAGVDRFNQAAQDLSIWEQKIKENSHTLDKESLQSEVAKFDEADKKLRREASLLELQSVFVAGVGERNEVDKNLLKKREYAIKAKIGNTAAGFVRALTDQVGSMAAGAVDFSSPATSNLTDQAIMDFLGVLPEGQKKLSENEFEDRVLPTVRNWLTSSTGIDRFVSKEYIDTKKEESLFHGGLYAVAEMIPSVALSMTGAGAPAMAGGFFLSSYDQLGQEMSDPIWDQVNPTEKEFMRVGISSVSAGLSTMGMQALAGKLPFVKNIWFNVAKKIAPGMSSGDIRLLIDGETKTWVANMSSKLIQGFGNEGFEEVLDFSQEEGFKAAYEKYKESEFGDKANDLFANVETMKEFANGALNSFIVGGIAGDIMGGSIAATSSIGARERLTRKEFSLFSSVLREGDLAKVFEVNAKASLDEGKMDQAEYDKFLRNIEVAKNAMDQIPRDMDIEPSRKAFELLLEKEKLSKLNKSLVGDKMNVIDEKLAALATSPTKDTGKEKPLEVKPLEVKPNEPTSNETKERSTLAETKEDGTAKEGANIVREAETTNELREDILGDLPKDGSGQGVKPNETLETEVPSGPTNATASGVSTDQNAGPGSTLQPQEQPATPEPVSNKPGEGKGTKESPYITRSGKKYGNFEITRDPDTGKNTIKPRSKSKDTWSKLPDKLAAKEYRAHKKRLLQAMRDAEVEFSKSTGHPINPRTGDPIGDGKRKKAERVSYQKEVDRKAGELSTTDKGTFGIALAWLSDGNTKISPESVRAYLGWGAGRNEGANAKHRVGEEEKNSKWVLGKEGKGINISALAHKMWEENLVDGETLPGYETTDFEEAIAAVITGYKNTDEAYSALDELVRDKSPLDVDEQVRAYYEAQMANVTEEDVTREDIERTDAYIDKLTEDELDKLWEEKNAFEAEAANVGTEQGDTVSVPDQQGSKRAETGKEGKVTAKIKGISTEAQKEIDEALGLSSTDNSGALAQKPTNTRTINTGKLRTDRVVAALKKLVPNLKIVAPKTNNGYAEATKDIGEGLESTWGIYDPRTNKLYLNPSSPDLIQTLFHEAAHPIIIALAKNKPELFSKFYDQVRTENGGKYTKFGQQYSDLSEAAQMAEALAEFFGDVVSGRVPVSTKPDSLYQQFKDFLKDILAALGWDMRSIDLGKPTDVREFAAQMKKAFDKGIAIEGFAPLEGNKEAKVALQDDADRLVDGWYSRLDQAVAAKGNTQSGADWMKWAEARAKEGALSMEEVKWTGLAEFLEGKAKVTPKEVREFLKENRVKVEVKEIGTPRLSKDDLDMFFTGDGFKVEAPGVGVRGVYVRLDQLDVEYDGENMAEIESLARDEALAEIVQNEDGGDTKFSQYQLPGGTNYREVLVTLPVKSLKSAREALGGVPKELTGTEAADAAGIDVGDLSPGEIVLDYGKGGTINKRPDGSYYTAVGFDEIETRNLSEAEDFLVKKHGMESGATKGDFRSSHFDEPNILVHLRLNDRTDADGKKVLFIEELQSDWHQAGRKRGYAGAPLSAKDEARYQELAEEGRRNLRGEVLAEFEGLIQRRDAAASGVPNAPFKAADAWVELGLKQAIRMAVEGGYDRIAWTNGEQQNERYDLSKQADSIDVSKDDTGMYKILAKKNGETTATKFAETPQEIEAFIGKDMAEKIVSANIPNGGAKVFSGVDLQLGGSGMKGFYDKILPNVAKKVSKKLGGDGKVGDTAIKDAGDQMSIEITDAMRDKVGLGVPLMQRKSPKQTASVFHKHGVNNLTARAHMESVGLDPAFIDDVLVELAGLENKKTPVSKSTSNTNSGEGKKVKKTVTTERAYEGDFRKGVKKELQKLGLYREIESRVDARESAKKFIESVGVDTALEAVRNNDVPGGAAAYIWIEAIEAIDRQITKEKDTIALETLYEKQASLIDEMGEQALSKGRFNSALGDIYKTSDLGFHSEKKATEWELEFGEKPSTELLEKWKERDKEFAQLKEKLAEAEKRAEEAEETATIKAIQDSLDREEKRKKQGKYTRKSKVVADQFRRLKEKPMTFKDADGNDIVISQMGFDWNALVEIGAKAIEKTGEILDGIAAIAEELKKQEWFSKMTASNQAAIMKQIEDHYNVVTEEVIESGTLKVPKQMIREAVANGAKTIDQLVAVIKEELKEVFPNATDREIRDAITEYGKTVSMSMDDLSIEVRRLKRVGRLVSALEDVRNKIRPLKSGLQRDKLDAEERALNKELKEAMKDLPIDEDTRLGQLKTTLDAAKSRARNRIEDLNREIATRTKIKKSVTRLEHDAELDALIAEKERIQEQHDMIFGDKTLTEAERLSKLIDSTRRSIEEYEKRIKDNDLLPHRSRPVVETQELRDLRHRRDVVKLEYRKLQEEAGIIEKQRLDTAKERAKQKIEDLRRRIEEGDFSKKSSKPVVADNEITQLNAEKIRLKEKYDKEFHRYRLAARSTKEKIGDAAWEAWALTRALQATGEFSFVLIQGGVLTISNAWHKPRAVGRAFKAMFSAMHKAENFEKWLSNVKAQEWYPIAKEAKLAITETRGEVSAREELFFSEWIKVIWNAIGSPLLLKGKGAHEVWKGWNPMVKLERGAAAYLDTLRVERFLDGMYMLDKNKAAGEKVTKQDYRDVADVANTLTGRASLGKAEVVANGLAKIFFSPRLWASAIKTATPYGLYHFGKMTPTARKMAIQDMGRFVGTTMTFVAAAAIYFANDDDDETGVEMDPRSSDFLKIRMGDTRIDPWGGRVQQVVFMSRLIMGALSLAKEKPLNAYKNGKGKLYPLGLPFRSPTMTETAIRMATNKLAPSASFIAEASSTTLVKERGKLERQTSFGEKYEISEAFKEKLAPIYWSTVAELTEEDPGALEGFLLLYSFLGGGVQVYDTDKKKKKKGDGNETKWKTP